ncbi:MAG: hypothetical protein KatS3mg129_2632 [Leptospiraceae bacterium]|nr:MAG: hypothetical protein KatS3mg129_2632 [Leptospiraceae bacterium]
MDKLLSNDNKVQKYIQKIIEEIKQYQPEKIILFGSRARGNNKPNSDIDIALDINLDFRKKRKLKERIDQISGLYSVDLIFLQDTTDNFKEKILKEGIILYEKNRSLNKNSKF